MAQVNEDAEVTIEVTETHYFTTTMSVASLAEELEIDPADAVKAVKAYNSGGDDYGLEDWIVNNYHTFTDDDSYEIDGVTLG